LYFLQKYSSFELCLVGVMGPMESGKSLLIDTVLNLTSTQGNQVLFDLISSQQFMGIQLSLEYTCGVCLFLTTSKKYL